MIHLINAKRAIRAYLGRLAYGCGLSYFPARLEIFTEERAIKTKNIPSRTKTSWICLRTLINGGNLRDAIRGTSVGDLELAFVVGRFHGWYLAVDQKPP